MNKENNSFLFKLLDYTFLFFIMYTLLVALQNEKLQVEILHELVFAGFIIISLVIILLSFLYDSKRVVVYMINWFNLYKKKFTLIVFFIVMIIQFIVLYHITTPIGWDVGGIFTGVTNLPNNPERINSYLSVNPNNSFFSFFMYGVTRILNNLSPSGQFGETWLAWQIFNTLLLDLGFIFIFFAAKNLFNTNIAYIAFYLSFIPLSLSPWILVPYTDIIIIPVIGFIFCVYALLKIRSFSMQINIVLSIVIGVMTCVSFLLKPSSIIFLIAWVIIEVIKLLSIKAVSLDVRKLILLSVFLFSFIGTVSIFDNFESNQEMITMNQNDAKPWLHFVNLGLKNKGGFNIEDTQTIRGLPDQESKIDYSKNEIKKRLSQHGVLGYPQFLMQKHRYNTDRGDFGWGFDGRQQSPETPPINYLAKVLRDSYYQFGGKIDNIRFFMQIFWIVTLTGLVFASRINDKHHFTRILKLGILGAFLFLLIFEGGRSRYLIQFLPMFYILSAWGWNYKICNWYNQYLKKPQY